MENNFLQSRGCIRKVVFLVENSQRTTQRFTDKKSSCDMQLLSLVFNFADRGLLQLAQSFAEAADAFGKAIDESVCCKAVAD